MEPCISVVERLVGLCYRASQSVFVSDDCINKHPRFKALTQNIRLRKAGKVAINLPGVCCIAYIHSNYWCFDVWMPVLDLHYCLFSFLMFSLFLQKHMFTPAFITVYHDVNTPSPYVEAFENVGSGTNSDSCLKTSSTCQ